MTDNGVNEKVIQLKSQVAALEQLLEINKEAVLEQGDRLEQALNALRQVLEPHIGELATEPAWSIQTRADMFVEHSPVILFCWRAAEDWPVEFVSENVSRFGYTSKELLSDQVAYASIIHPADLERVGREVAEYSEQGPDHFQQTYRIITKDGETRWIDVWTTIKRDDAERITRYQGVVFDITERRKTEVEHEQLLAQTEAQTRRLTRLNEMNTELSHTESEIDIYDIITRYVSEIFHSDRTCITILTPEGDRFDVLALSGEEGLLPVGTQGSVQGSNLAVAIHEKRVVTQIDAEGEDLGEIRSLMVAPLLVGDKVIGTVNVGSKEPNIYAQNDEDMLMQIAALLSSTLENRRLFEHIQAQAYQEQVLREVTGRIRGSVDVDTIMRTAAREIGQVLDRPAFVYLGNEGGGDKPSTVLEEKEA